MFSHCLLIYFMDDAFCWDGNVAYFESLGSCTRQLEHLTLIW